jgi:hypothetical protein
MAVSREKEERNRVFMAKLGFSKGEPYIEEKLDQKKTFLIICEGENTEPLYFEGFPVPSKTIITQGGHNTKTKLVDYALTQKNDAKYAGREIWCVFDYDVKPDEVATQPQDFNNAIEKAETNGLKVAWSNDAFELWFVLHYQTMESSLTRHEVYDILKPLWGLESFHKEAKTRAYCEGHYERHNGVNGANQTLAIRRASSLHEAYGSEKDYAKQSPCTTVYLLVEELNRNRKE